MIRVKVDRQERTELHEQVAGEIRRAIADGEAKPGQRLPPARDLADVLGVNTNTVLRASSYVSRAATGTDSKSSSTSSRASPERQARCEVRSVPGGNCLHRCRSDRRRSRNTSSREWGDRVRSLRRRVAHVRRSLRDHEQQRRGTAIDEPAGWCCRPAPRLVMERVALDVRTLRSPL